MKQLLKNLADHLYRWANRLVPFDIAVIYVLELTPDRSATKNTNRDNLVIRSLSEIDLAQLRDPAMDYSTGEADHLWSRCECMGAFLGESLVGYAWHANGFISAELNTAGPPFSGCAIELNAKAQYLFKVFVHPAHRGSGINVAMCEALEDDLIKRGCRYLVTLTEWNNRAFRNSVESMGFRSLGQCTEWVFANRSRYKLPGDMPQIARFTVA